MTTRRPPAVARVLERVTKTAREHEMFAAGDMVLVSVSGGPDSVCLLFSLWYLRRLFKIRLAVFHFDHRLREGSGADATYVHRLSTRLGLGSHLAAATDAPPRGVSVEAWASAAREDAANDVRREIGARIIAEGHTLDDQAETVLLNLVRGTGLEGMTGIAPRLGGPPGASMVQPLIDLERPEIEAFCRALRLRPRVDPTNTDRRLLRNAIRLDVLPELERATGRSAKGSIVRTAALLREDRRELETESARLYRSIVSEDENRLTFDAEALAGLSRALAGRVVRLAVYRTMSGDWAAPWSRETIDAVIDLAAGRPGRKRDLPGGSRANRDRTHVVIER